MRNLISCIPACFVLVLVTHCTRVEVRNTLTEPRADLAWPSNAPARIRYIASVRTPDDLFVRENRLVTFLAGPADRSFRVPFDVHMTADGLLLVTDPGRACLHYMDLRALRYKQIQSLRGRDVLIQPIGVTTDRDGNIYVSDASYANVAVFDRGGQFQRFLEPPHFFGRPAGLACSPATGELFIADVTAHTIRVVKPDGTAVRSFGRRGVEPSSLNFPTHVWVMPDGAVLVDSAMDAAIKVFDPQGRFLASFGTQGDAPGYFGRPKGVAADSDGHVYVADALYDNFQIFDRRGRLLLGVGRSGAGLGEFWLPAGLFIDSTNRIFVADQQNHRIQVFQYTGGAAQ